VTISLFLDLIVAVLLVATIIYAAMLNRRLAGLRSNKAELEALIHSFGEACARAEAGVKTLRTATDEATRLQQYLDRSQALRDDLAFLLDRGTSLADRLEGGVRTARTESQSRPMAAPVAMNDPEPAPNRFGRPPRAERGGPTGPALAPIEPEPLANRLAETPERAAERIAQRVTLDRGERPVRAPGRPERPGRERSNLRTAMADAAVAQAAPAERPAAAEAAPRSKAERELLQALRTRR
jgi:hypothetical protein